MEGPQPVNVEAARTNADLAADQGSSSFRGGIDHGRLVYHGSRLPELAGAYIYGDYQSGIIWGLRVQGETVTWHRELAHTPLHVVAFGENNYGEIYLLDHDRTHQIYRLVPNRTATITNNFPRRLSQTGLFASTGDHRPAPGVIPYSVNAPLWSDGATAERFLAVPDAGRIELDNQGIWRFPDRSVLVRTISIDREPGQEASPRRRIETQVLHLEAGAWRPYSYAWNDEQTDAVLVSAEGASQTIVRNAAGGRRKLNYRIHARTECGSCHNPWVEKRATVFGIQSASPLGVTSAQLNRKCDDATVLSQPAWDVVRRWGFWPGRLISPGYRSLSTLTTSRSISTVGRGRICKRIVRTVISRTQVARPPSCSATKRRSSRRRPSTSGRSRGRSTLPERRSSRPAIRAAGAVLPDVETGRRADAAGRIERGRRVRHPNDSRVDRPDAVGQGRDIGCERRQGGCRRSGGHRVIAASRSAFSRSAGGRDRPADVVNWRCFAAPGRDRPGTGFRGITGEIVETARISPLVEVRDLFERFIPEEERTRRLGDVVDRAALLALPGDIARGRLVFTGNAAAQCKSCHKAGNVGDESRADLTKIGAKYNKPALLDQILEPSRTIEPQYTAYLLETKDGRVLSGLAVERTKDAVVLKDAQGKTIKVASVEIDRLVPQSRSLMPELLLRDLTAQDVADLLEFLASMR